MPFLPQLIQEYAEKHTESEPTILKELSRETHLKVLQPRMLSGHYQGRILSFLSCLTKPKTILEIGTYTGYSAICLAEGLQDNGILHTLDKNEELVDLQSKYFEKAGLDSKIIQHTGEAESILRSFDMRFDLVFLDADKENYNTYYPIIKSLLTKGGLLITDNVLWDGKVLQKAAPNDVATQSLLKYNQVLQKDSDFKSLLLTVRDGLTVSLKNC